jgi:hypothetical protein
MGAGRPGNMERHIFMELLPLHGQWTSDNTSFSRSEAALF